MVTICVHFAVAELNVLCAGVDRNQCTVFAAGASWNRHLMPHCLHSVPGFSTTVYHSNSLHKVVKAKFQIQNIGHIGSFYHSKSLLLSSPQVSLHALLLGLHIGRLDNYSSKVAIK